MLTMALNTSLSIGHDSLGYISNRSSRSTPRS
jgi:hypothetical protein